jgi:hypothetical protein
MATIYLTQSPKTDANGESEILIRFSHGKINQRAKSNIFLSSKYWNAKEERISIPKARVLVADTKKLIDDLNAKNERLATITANILKSFNEADKKAIPADWLKLTIDKLNFPEKYEFQAVEPEIKTLFQFIDDFVSHASGRKNRGTGRTLSKRTTVRYGCVQKQIMAFAKSRSKVDFYFSEIDQSFYDNEYQWTYNRKEFFEIY